jgi:hypothetical protein
MAVKDIIVCQVVEINKFTVVLEECRCAFEGNIEAENPSYRRLPLLDQCLLPASALRHQACHGRRPWCFIS